MDPTDARCTDIRALLPELALGIADGEDRAVALEHLSTCSECRRELADLSATADDLLALAPAVEPPAGFEGRVLKGLRVREPRTRRRWRRRRLGVVSAAIGAAAATAVAMTLVYSGDHRLASQYQAALRDAHGQYFASARLRTQDGATGGVVFGYQGSPSWLFFVIRGQHDRGRYTERLVTRTGRSISLPPFRLVSGSWGVATPIPVRDIAAVQLVRRDTGTMLRARLPVVDR